MQDINKAGSNDCLLTSGPCGGRPAGRYPTYYRPGEKVTVVFQKNLDHWVKSTPGNFTVSLMMEGSSSAIASNIVTDMGEPSLTIYSATLMIPASAAKGKYVIQAVYNTNNPQAPPQFYQCSDVMLDHSLIH